MKLHTFKARSNRHYPGAIRGLQLFATDGEHSLPKGPFNFWDLNDARFAATIHDSEFVQIRNRVGSIAASASWNVIPKTDGTEAMITNVVTSLKYQERGYGRAIIESVHTRMIEEGVEIARLYAIGEAVTFYPHLGYELSSESNDFEQHIDLTKL